MSKQPLHTVVVGMKTLISQNFKKLFKEPYTLIETLSSDFPSYARDI